MYSGSRMEKKFSALLLYFFTLTLRAIYYSLSITKDMKEGSDEYAA